MKKGNKFTKAIAIVLSLVMILGIGSVTFASTDPGSVSASSSALFKATTSANSTSGVTTVTPTTVIPDDYSFGAKWISRVSSFEPFGNWDNIDTDEYSASNVSARIPANNTSFKGTLGAWYRKMGTYQGKTVDVKVTFVDYKHLKPLGKTTSQMVLMLVKNRIRLCGWGFEWLDIKYEFFNHATGQPLNVKGFMTFSDIDDGQAVTILNNAGKLYVSSKSNLRTKTVVSGTITFLSDTYWTTPYGPHNNIIEDSLMTCFLGSSQAQRFHMKNTLKLNYATAYYGSGYLEKFSDIENVAGHVFGYAGEPLGRPELDTPYKSVYDRNEALERASDTTNTIETLSEEYNYSIDHIVPLSDKDNFFKTYVMEDTLANCLEYKSSTVYDESGDDVTTLFNVAVNGQKVTFTAKNSNTGGFYGNTYRYDIRVKIKDGYDMAPWLVSNVNGVKTYQIKNNAKVTVTREGTETKTTNDTTTTVKVYSTNNQVRVIKTDSKSGANLSNAEFVLQQWSVASGNKYVDKEKLIYDAINKRYQSALFSTTTDNLGKFKVVETKTPPDYTGTWEKEFNVTDDSQVFSYNVTNDPNGSTTIEKKSVVIKEGVRGAETGTTATPTIIEKGDTIEYNLYVKRSGALGYKSGTLTITDAIPEDAIYSDETLHITGEITKKVIDSTAKVESMKCEDGVVTWIVTGLDKDEVAHLTFKVVAPNKEVVLKNEALLKDPQDSGDIPSNPVEHQVDLPELVIEKTSVPEDKSQVDVSDDIKYFVKVSNIGKARAKNVLISDTIPEGTTYIADSIKCEYEGAEVNYDEATKCVTSIVPILKAGEDAILEFSVTVDKTREEKTIENVATVKEGDEPEIPSLPVTHKVVQPELSIVKSSNPKHESEVKAGDTITYTVEVNNNGKGKAVNVSISDVIPVGTTYVVNSVLAKINEVAQVEIGEPATNIETTENETAENEETKSEPKSTKSIGDAQEDTPEDASEEKEATTAAYDADKNSVLATFATIKAGETAVLEFAVTVDESDEAKTIKNVAILKEDDEPEVPSNVIVHVQNKLIPIKSSDPVTNTAVYGEDIITYFVEVTNGTEVDAKNVIVRDMIPEHTSYVVDSMETEVTDAKMELVTIDGKEYVTYILPEVKANTKVMVSFKVKVDITDKPTDIINVAQVKETEEGKESSEAIIEIEGYKDTNETIHYMNQVSIAKSSDPESGSKVKKDDTITYKLAVTNDSKSDAKNVIVRDMIPEHTSYIKKSATMPKNAKVETISINGKDYLVWVIEELKMGETVELTFKAKVTTDKADTVIKNMAQVKEAKTDNPFEEAKEDIGFKDSNEVNHTLEIIPEPTPALEIQSAQGAQGAKTGDNTTLTLWLTLGGIALISIIGTLIYRKRKTQAK